MGDGLSILSYTADTLHDYARMVSNSFGNTITKAEYTNEKISSTANQLSGSLSTLNCKINRLRVKSLTLKSSALDLSEESEAEALRQLRLKHLCDGEITRLSRARFLVEAALLHLESAGVMIETASSIQTAACQFKEIQPDKAISCLEDNIEHVLDFKDCLSEFEDCMTGTIKGTGPEDQQLMEELQRLRSSKLPRHAVPDQPHKEANPQVLNVPAPPSHTPEPSSTTRTLELAF